jgi:response regulator RpfG family c-di-GMP phosphodiesterase
MVEIEKLIVKTKKLTLLYVEDNEDARLSTQLVLEEFFKDIVFALDGEDGYRQFQNNESIDIVLTDLNMPRRNGIEMIKAIREIDKTTPILILSACDELESEYETLKTPLNLGDFILKPMELEKFLDAVAKATL